MVDEEPEREAWLSAEGWKVTAAQNGSNAQALAESLGDAVGDNQ